MNHIIALVALTVGIYSLATGTADRSRDAKRGTWSIPFGAGLLGAVLANVAVAVSS